MESELMIEIKKMIDQSNKVARVGETAGLSLMFCALRDSDPTDSDPEGELTSCLIGIRIAQCVKDQSHPQHDQRRLPSLIARFMDSVIPDETKGFDRMNAFAKTMQKIVIEFAQFQKHNRRVGKGDDYGMDEANHDKATYQLEKMLKNILKNN